VATSAGAIGVMAAAKSGVATAAAHAAPWVPDRVAAEIAVTVAACAATEDRVACPAWAAAAMVAVAAAILAPAAADRAVERASAAVVAPALAVEPAAVEAVEAVAAEAAADVKPSWNELKTTMRGPLVRALL
jgi:hypothetical protein